MSDERQYCTFYLNGAHFGIEVLAVQEVIRSLEATPVPLAPPVVHGLINLRGRIVTALDLRRRLDMPERPRGQDPLNVVVRTDDGAVSLLVDEIGDVLRVSGAAFERPPDTLRGSTRGLILGAYKLEGQLLLILDAQRTVDLSDANQS